MASILSPGGSVFSFKLLGVICFHLSQYFLSAVPTSIPKVKDAGFQNHAEQSWAYCHKLAMAGLTSHDRPSLPGEVIILCFLFLALFPLCSPAPIPK